MLPGQPFELWKTITGKSQTIAVVKTDAMRIIQLLIPAGQTIPRYEAQGEAILHCLQGKVAVSAQGDHYYLSSGELLYLTTSEPFSLKAKENVSLLVTMIGRTAAGDDTIGS
ncbi:MAG TPA: cupin [Pirellulales bacterium]|nr:cupin [Pirellulales bacterium]